MIDFDLASETAPPVRIGVVGLGYWGPNLVRVLAELQEAQLAAVCDKSPTALAAMRRRYPGIPATGDYAELLHNPDVDAIAIVTPVSTHHDLAAAAISAGKHVFVEKPLAASSEEALHLVELAAGHGLTLMPGHTFLYSPAVNAVRDLIKSGDLGGIYFISMSRVNLGLHQPDVSVAWDLGPHDFSILRYWLGEVPETVSVLTRGCVFPQIADVAFINIRFRTGTIAHVELSWLAPSKLRRTTVVGSQKMVVYDDTSITEPVRIYDSSVLLARPETFGEYQLSYRTGEIVSPRIDIAEPLALEMRDFCNSITRGAEPRSSLQVGLDVVRVIEATERSQQRGGAETSIPQTPDLAVALCQRIANAPAAPGWRSP